jgi:hypothetical protein
MPLTLHSIPKIHRLWRYFDEEKFKMLVDSESLWFSRPSRFGDKNEGRESKSVLVAKMHADLGEAHHNELYGNLGISYAYFSVEKYLEHDKMKRDQYGVSCWHANHNESF